MYFLVRLDIVFCLNHIQFLHVYFAVDGNDISPFLFVSIFDSLVLRFQAHVV